ncbi:glycosyltransferase family 2 protein [Candidatus Parcubacteria bacterium]|nr:glycosyltransferase family 2 protein [Candidatus Parcubacteria bacterium]
MALLMALQEVILYTSLFISLFFEVFLLITYFEVRDELKFEEEHFGHDIKDFPTVTVIVPCFNEEITVKATLDSLLALDYPRDKFSLIVVDDGSTDNTQGALDNYRDNSQIRIFKKENGGKYTALNFALTHVESDLVGCLDADSFVDSQALLKIVPYFTDSEIMAVTPSIKVHEPKNLLQLMQKAEYSWGIFMRRMLSKINALYVTPGPFSIFRTRVFRELGGYKHAHNTEDMELALRMQKNGYKIVNSVAAQVYTITPPKLSELYKQRRRWTYGFLKNAVDYKDMYFNNKYGNIGIFILPVATVSIFSTIFAAGNLVWGIGDKILKTFSKYKAINWSFHLPSFHFDWYFWNTGSVMFLGGTALLLSVIILFYAYKIAYKTRPGREVVYYFLLYMFIVPIWLSGAVYSSIFSRNITWK